MARLPARTTAYLYLLLTTLTWGAALPIVKLGLPFTTPYRYLLYRYILCIILSLPILFYFIPRVKKLPKQVWTIFGVELIGTTLALGMLYTGLNRTSALEASLISTTSPIFITVGAILFLREREESREWIGMAIAFVGTVLLAAGPLMSTPIAGQQNHLIGNLLIIGQNVANAGYFILAKRFYHKLPKFFVTTISFYVGAISFFILSLFETHGSLGLLATAVQSDLSYFPVWVIVLYMAIFGSLIGLTAYIKGQDKIEVSEASVFCYLQPLVYIPLSFLFLGERVTFSQIAALVLILVGVVMVEKRAKKKKSSIV